MTGFTINNGVRAFERKTRGQVIESGSSGFFFKWSRKYVIGQEERNKEDEQKS